MTDHPFEDWPTGRNRIETPTHVHAFGMIALNSAMLEEVLLLLLLVYLPIEKDTAVKLTDGLNNRERADWLLAIVERNERNPYFTGWVKDAIRCSDVCFANRNMLVHALYSGTSALTEKMTLTKRASNDPLRELRFELSTKELRKIADDIGNSINFVLDIWYLKTHTDHDHLSHIALREKPPQPERLKIPQPAPSL